MQNLLYVKYNEVEIMTFTLTTLLYLSIILYIVLLIYNLVKKKFTALGFMIHFLTFFAGVMVIYFALFPYNIFRFDLSFFSWRFIPFYYTISIVENFENGIGKYIQYLLILFIISFPFAAGKSLLLRNKKRTRIFLIVFYSIIMLLALIRGMFDSGYVFDIGNIIILLLGSVFGIYIGGLFKKSGFMKLHREIDEE